MTLTFSLDVSDWSRRDGRALKPQKKDALKSPLSIIIHGLRGGRLEGCRATAAISGQASWLSPAFRRPHSLLISHAHQSSRGSQSPKSQFHLIYTGFTQYRHFQNLYLYKYREPCNSTVSYNTTPYNNIFPLRRSEIYRSPRIILIQE